MKKLQRAFCILLVSCVGAQPAFAAPKVTETVTTYPVTATSASGLRREMAQKGPKGFWGYTRWDIRWTAGCDVRVSVKYTLPRHANPDAMSPVLRRAFARMLARLEEHERLHGKNGIDAAYEIDRAGCRGAHKIIRKYNKADRELDRRTKHGARDGVVLP